MIDFDEEIKKEDIYFKMKIEQKSFFENIKEWFLNLW